MPPLKAPQWIISIDFHSHLITASFPAQTPVTPVIMAIFTRNRKGIEECWMGRWVGFGLFDLREGRRLFVPHGQGVARRKNLDLHQLFMHFQREAITALNAGMLVGGQGELIGQAVAGTAVRWLNKRR